MIVVSDTSPITSLAAIGQLNLLQQIYGTIIIPEAVDREMTDVGYPVPGMAEVQTLSWIRTEPVKNKDLVSQFQTELDRGESEAIALAIELNANLLIIDENPGRKVSTEFNLEFIGILGVLLIAKQEGLIEVIKPIMDNLIDRAGFRINQQLYITILNSANES
ncbi:MULTISPECIES: DUF3368 domain-containing protein [unclassified Roseofilum]|uniref:DUF3368 domain-containing protein n=1 Tax=unclassified Roseofilum TaxID=2620099 RepID=UPI001B2BD0D7|nr:MULTISPECIES: DUF3368 domain-containing protein [unclassified Roseofilum]MBP0010964.1 DUF3368 domain-containing protein [Roseofilum sp. Belize Diploria]MBP0035371.1 DUF3368 domain-containing protein [Roseofilum sp. Belize BBD 4]